VVSVLATEPQGSRTQTRPKSMNFEGDKIRGTPSFGGHVKEPYEHDGCSSAKFSGHVSHSCFTCSATRWCLLALLTDVPGGRIRWLEPG
jgi:hypothetical protein